jgi:hypothetical protein
MYIVLQTNKGVSCLTVIESKRQFTMPCGGRNRKQQSQDGILKNSDE